MLLLRLLRFHTVQKFHCFVRYDGGDGVFIHELLVFLLQKDDKIVKALYHSREPRPVDKVHGDWNFFLAHLVQKNVLEIDLRLSHPPLPRNRRMLRCRRKLLHNKFF